VLRGARVLHGAAELRPLQLLQNRGTRRNCILHRGWSLDLRWRQTAHVHIIGIVGASYHSEVLEIAGLHKQ
jgi:hypothetical protein